MTSIERQTGHADQSITLFCAWQDPNRSAGRETDGHNGTPYVAAKVDTTEEVADFLRDATRRTLALIRQHQPVTYTAEAELKDDEVFILDQPAVLEELADFRALTDQAAGLDRIDPRELQSKRLALYGTAAGDDSPRLGLIRKANPVKVATKGRLLTTGHRRLAKLSDPLFEFDGKSDFVLGDGWAAVLNQRPFELLLRESPTMHSHVATWVDSIASALPLSAASEEALRLAASRDSRLWRRLRTIYQRGHLSAVSLDTLKAYAAQVDLDTDELIIAGKLQFQADDRFTIIKLLNEDLYSGGLTGEPFEAHRKAPLE